MTQIIDAEIITFLLYHHLSSLMELEHGNDAIDFNDKHEHGHNCSMNYMQI